MGPAARMTTLVSVGLFVVACSGTPPVSHDAAVGAPAEDPSPVVRDLTPRPLGDRLEASIDTGGLTPDRMVVTDDAVWVNNQREGSIVRIDPATNAVVAEVRVEVKQFKLPDGRVVGSKGTHGPYLGAGQLWFENTNTQTVLRIDPATASIVKELPVADRADDIVVTEEGLWYGDPAGEVLRVDVETGERDTVDIGAGARVLLHTDDAIWAGADDCVLRRIDPRTLAVRETNAQAGCYGLSAAGGHLWGVDPETRELVRFDGAGASELARLTLPGLVLDHTSFATDGNDLWVRVYPTTLHRVDIETNEVTEVIELPAAQYPSGVAVGFGSVWVTNRDEGTVYRFRP